MPKSDVKVIIKLSSAAGEAGLGFPLILTGKQSTAVVYTECSSLDDVEKLFQSDTAVYKAANLIFMQSTPPEKIAVCGSTDTALDAIKAVKDKDWRQLIVVGLDSDTETTAANIATYIETTDKMYFTSASSKDAMPEITGMDRTVIFVCGGNSPEAALVGATASKSAGSFTYKNQILKGISPMDLSDADIEAIHTAGGITFITKAGDNVTSEGKTVSGEYIDIIDSKDYIIKNITYRTQKALNAADKIPYDDTGIAQLENICVDVLQDAYNNGMIAVDADGAPDYSVDYAPRSETAAGDRAERNYKLGKFSFALAGAIHTATINGEIEV